MTGTLFGPSTLLGPEPAMAIGGRRVGAAETRPVENPATGEPFTEVPEATAGQVAEALEAAAAAQRAWGRRSHPQDCSRDYPHSVSDLRHLRDLRLLPTTTARSGRISPAAHGAGRLPVA